MKNVVFDLGAVLLSWEPVSLVHAVLAPHTPTAQAAHALAREMFHHEDWLGFDRGTHSLEDAIGRMALQCIGKCEARDERQLRACRERPLDAQQHRGIEVAGR